MLKITWFVRLDQWYISSIMKFLRSLLVSVLFVTGATAFAPVSPSAARRASLLSMTVKEVNIKDVIKVGVIGMGRIGLVHLEAIAKAPGVTPVIVSNPTISKAENGAYLSTANGTATCRTEDETIHYFPGTYTTPSHLQQLPNYTIFPSLQVMRWT